MHEACKNSKLDVLLGEDLLDLLKALLLVLAIKIDQMEGDARLLGDAFAVVPVANHRGDLNGHFAKLGSPEDFVEAMIGFCHKNRRPHFVG